MSLTNLIQIVTVIMPRFSADTARCVVKTQQNTPEQAA